MEEMNVAEHSNQKRSRARRRPEDALKAAHSQCGPPKCTDCGAELAQAMQELQGETLRRKQAEEALQLRTAQLKATALELAHAEARERQRIAAMLHDDVQQLLAAAQFKLALFAEAPDQDDLQEAIREVTGLLNEAIAQTRSLAAELSPPVPLKDGLVPALEWLGRWMQQKHGLTIRVTATEQGLEAGDEGTRLMLFNAVRELLFNVTKHAKVTAASVQVQRVGDLVEIVVEDKGVGSAALGGNMPENTGNSLGLFSIRHRLDLIGGHFEVESAPERGSRFTLHVPLGGQPAAGRFA
jgi:signal transduction histidine kinase